MMLGVLQSNRDNVIEVIRHYHAVLDEIETALEERNEAQLQTLLNKAESRYIDLMTR